MKNSSHTNRLYEVMGLVNPDFKHSHDIRLIKESIHQLAEEDYEQPEEEVQISPEDEKNAAELDKRAETAVAREEDNQKPVVQENQRGVNLTVTVPTYKKRVAEKNIESLNKLARRLGIAEPKVTIGEVRTINVKDPYDDIPPYRFYAIDVYDITIETEGMFALPGNYKLVAVVDNTTGGSIEIDEDESVPKEFLQTSGQCDLCKQERYRGKNFIVKDGDSGEYMRLGSSCVKKYIGIDPSKYIRTLNYLRDFQITMGGYMDDDDLFGDPETGGGRKGISESNRLVDINKVISIIHDFMQQDGYIKREWGETNNRWGGSERYRTNDGEATADKTEAILYDDEKFNEYPLNEKYVNDFKNFANTLEPLPPKMIDDPYGGGQIDKNQGFNEYRQKIKDFANKENFRIRETALLASGINYFENEKKREEKAKELQGSEWIGEVGQKIKIPYAKLDGYRTGEGQFGTWELWSFIDENGNSLKKFGNLPERFKISDAPEGSENMGGYKKGDVFAFTSDIKKHDQYQGTKQTQLGRFSKL